MATLVLPDAKKLSQRRGSCETLCSSNSSCVLQKRKPTHPLATLQRRPNNSSIGTVTSISQRVLSAKVLRFKTLQNQLNDANYHISQLTNENRILKTLQKRQDHALSKYEGPKAELAQVLESHHEEVRVLQLKNKNLRKTVRELMDQIKFKEDELNGFKDQNKHLLSLCKSKNLDEREKMAEKIQDLEERLRQSESVISTLNRKMMLESKNSKYKLNAEIIKHKQTQKELAVLLNQMENNSTILEVKEKLDVQRPRKSSTDRKSTTQLQTDGRGSSTKRLSGNTKSHNCTSSLSSTNLSEDIESFSSSSSKPNAEVNKKQKSPRKDTDMSSEAQLKEIVNNWHKKNEKTSDQSESTLNEYCLISANETNEVIEKHSFEYKQSMKDTTTILETLKENDLLNNKLNKLQISEDGLAVEEYTDDQNDDLSPKMYAFQEDSIDGDDTEDDDEGQNSPLGVDEDEKQKLLATLRAIDNGDNISFVENTVEIPMNNGKSSKTDLMKELFG